MPITGYAQKGSIMTNTNNSAKTNIETVAKFIDKVSEYVRSDNGHKALAMVLSVRFKKEDKSIKTEDSHGFKAYANAVREASKEIGVKAYYTSFIAQYKYDEKGEYVRDEFGDRVKTNVGGWLFEVAGGGTYDKALLLKAVDKAKAILRDGVADGTYVLAEKKEKKASVKRVTKSELEAQNNLLKEQMAAMQKQMAELMAAMQKNNK